MKILGIDTSSMMGAVGIVDGEDLVAEVRTNVAVTYSERLMLHIDGLLKTAGMSISDIDGFSVNIGPGSFTGLRIGLAAVKGLAYSTGRPVAGVGCMEVLSGNVPFSRYQVCTLMDARKKQVYAALFKDTDAGREAVMPVTAMTPEELMERVTEPTLFLGEGAHVYREILARELGDMAVFAPRSQSYPSGAAVAFLGLREIMAGRASDPFTLVPHYVRRSDAEEKRGGD